MKTIVISLLIFNLSTALFAQNLQRTIIKPVFDTSVFGRWRSAQMPEISNDGNYAWYMIRNQPAEGSTLVIRSLINEWERKIINASNSLFTNDSRKVFFISPGRTLCGITLGREDIDSIAEVSSYRLVKRNVDEWLVYKLNNAAKELKVVNLKNNIEKSFTGVIDYLFSADGNVLVLLKQQDTDNKLQTIDWISFPSGEIRNIWNGIGAKSFILDEGGDQLAFVVEIKDTEKYIFYYKAGGERAELLADNRTKGIDSSLIINGISGGFSKDGEKLYINLKEKERPKPQPGSVMVDVWNYQDMKLQSIQLLELGELHYYKAVADIKAKKIRRLQQQDDKSILIPEQWQDAVITSHYIGDLPESEWNPASSNSFYIISTNDGKRKRLPLNDPNISPNGRYIIGNGIRDKWNYYSYDNSTNKLVNITSNLGQRDKQYDYMALPSKYKWVECAGWLENSQGLLIYDRHDIWLVDPKGEKASINLTNGYGRRTHIIFRMVDAYLSMSHSESQNIYSESENIIVKGFNMNSKKEGLYLIQLKKSCDPVLLTAGDFKYEIPRSPFNLSQLKSSGSKTLLLRRESATESPNYFLTSDFKKFTAVTNVYPEKTYNWLDVEMHSWKSLDGTTIQGILYKPENFDPNIKYPVIIHFYENMSDKRNKYRVPAATTDHINIPWFVSRGYLVFAPDIYFTWGNPGESAYNSVVSAAKYLSKFSWVAKNKIAIQGQSFGGYETNYIITRSSLFAAAMSSSGRSDLVSSYNDLNGERSNQPFLEKGQYKMGVTLWERPELYIKNSPVFHANKIYTPLLMMNNKKDVGVPFNQGIELFLALRRLGKKVWMLQYDNGGHTVRLPNDALQHTIRITQFFDHYLKDSACPRWMLYGIPAKMKGIDDGLELVKEKDPKTGKWVTPQEGGLLTDEEKKKVEALKRRKPITIKLE